MADTTYSIACRDARERSQIYEREAMASVPTKAASVIDTIGGGSGSSFGGDVKRQSQTAQGYQHFRHWVYVCISLIAKRIAGQPVCAGFNPNAKSKDDRDPERSFSSRKLTKWESRDLPPRLLKSAANGPDFEMLLDHESLAVFERPNPIQRKFEFLWLSVVNILLTGESYWLIDATKAGNKGSRGKRDGDAPANSVELWSIPTTWITPVHDGGIFTGYKLQVSYEQEPIELTPDQVCRTYFPDPSNLNGALSPVATQISAIRTDDYIQTSQEDSFRRGVFPNVAIKVGQTLDAEGKPTGARPTLDGAQRRQLIRAVRQVWDRTVAQGDPAILDGLIEDVFKLQVTPKEMDWLKSGEQTKARIFEAFGVHPFMAGEAVSVGGYAQAAIIEGVFADNVNPIADAFSTSATSVMQPLYKEPSGLQVWIEPLKPRNDEMRQREWEFARKNEDVTRDEYRAERLGLPPSEDKPRLRLLETVGGMTGAVSVLTAVGQGLVQPESAVAAFKLFFQLDDVAAAELVGSARPQTAEIQGGAETHPIEDPENQGLPLIVKGRGGATLSRDAIKASHAKQVNALEQGVADALQRFFREPNQEYLDSDESARGSRPRTRRRASKRAK